MANVPETSDSLIARVKDTANGEAWAEFLDVYQPVILRMARRRNLQDGDAQDVCQKVLFAVSQAISKWEPQLDHPFRAWLGRNRSQRDLERGARFVRITCENG